MASGRQTYALHGDDPELLADAVVELIGKDATWPVIPTEVALRAAELIHELAPARSRGESASSAPSTASATAAPL